MKETPIQKYRRERKELNRKRTEFYLTDYEKAELKAKLAELRKDS